MRYVTFAMISLGAIFMFACAPPPKAPDAPAGPKFNFLEDIEGKKELSAAEQAEDRDVKEEYQERKALIAKITKQDLAEQAAIAAKKEEIEETREGLSALTRELLEKAERKQIDELIDRQVMASLKSSSTLTREELAELMAAVNRGEKSIEELRQILRDNTNLSEAQIDEAIASLAVVKEKRKELEQLVASTTNLKELEQILKERSGLSETEIAGIIQQKEQLLTQERNLKEEALSKIHARLIRNRELKIELAFCAETASLDQFVLPPSYFDFDVHKMDRGTLDAFIYEMELMAGPFLKYTDLFLQVEGNADERGSTSYNKALGDRRWYGPTEILLSSEFDDDVLKGVSKGEECAVPRQPNWNDETFWQKNRRNDYVIKLK